MYNLKGTLISKILFFFLIQINGKVHENFIDLNNLIVISDTFSEGSSFFGLSVVLWNEGDSGGNKSWILIGSPKGNYSNSSRNNALDEPGVLWRCSLDSDSEDTCEILAIDPTKAGGKDCRPVRCADENKNNSWLGATIVTSEKNPSRLVVCAPHWKREEIPGRGNFKFNGLCYWLPRKVIESEPFDMSPMIKDYFTSQRLFPFVDAKMQTVSRFPVYANGQVGFSSHLAPDGSLFLGAPGVNGWNGTIVRYMEGVEVAEGWEIERGNRNDQTEFSQFNVLRTEFTEHFYHLEYFGYAVTTGFFVQNHYAPTPTRLVAAGAPRGGETPWDRTMKGIVLIFRYPDQIAWLPEIPVLLGTQFGSYFGSVLCSVDLNGDGMEELIVGAPFQNLHLEKAENTTASSKKARAGEGDQGCIFVYTSKIEHYTFGEPEVICGAKTIGAKFGTTISTLGDINADGFNDFAVGAPFENDGEGAVYVYTGSPNFGLNIQVHNYYLKITPSIINIPLVNFGISIFGGVDLDGNETPDFAIGSTSQSVVIIRTRASIKFEGKIDIYINETDESEKLPLDTTEFTIRSCNRMLSGPSHATFELSISLSLDEEKGRFRFLESLEDIPHNITGNSTLEYTIQMKLNLTICHEWLAQTTSDFEPNESHPKPLTIAQTLVYEEEFHDPDLELTRYHKIYKTENGEPEVNISVPGFHDFCSFCPPKTTLTTYFHLPIAADNCMDDGDPICTPDLQINFFSLDGATSSLEDKFIVGAETMYTLRIQLDNADYAETLYFPALDIFWKSPPLPQITPDCKLNLTQSLNRSEADIQMQCDLGYTLQRNETKQIELRLYMHGIFAVKRREELKFEVAAYPFKEPLANKTRETLVLILEANVDTYFTGSSENVTFSNDAFTNVTQTFRISVLGESPVENIAMTFWFPLKKGLGRKDSQFIFVSQPERSTCWGMSRNGNYFEIERFDDFQSTTTPTMKKIPNRKLHHNDWTNRRHGSTLKEYDLPKEFGKKNKVNVPIYCNNGGDMNCIQVECEATNIIPNHNILLEFRLSVDTEFTKNLLKSNGRSGLEIHSFGFLQILDDTVQFTTARTRISEFVGVTSEASVGLWIYLVSGIIGILILILLILLLIRCGFFQRPARVTAELHPTAEEPTQIWARWEYSQIYSPN